MQADWQAFLNLCLAQETHLDNVEAYKKVPDVSSHHVQAGTGRASDSLLNAVPAGRRDAVRVPGQTRFHPGPRVSGEEEQPRGPAGAGGTARVCCPVRLSAEPHCTWFPQAEEPALRRNEQRLDALRELSGRVAPLKLRRLPPSRPTTVVSLCDWIDEVRPPLTSASEAPPPFVSSSPVFGSGLGETWRDSRPQVQLQYQGLEAAEQQWAGQNAARGLFHGAAPRRRGPGPSQQVGSIVTSQPTVTED